MTRGIVIAAGGTAGHLVPGFAIAEEIHRRAPGTRIMFVGTDRGMERDLVPAAGYEFQTTAVRPFGRSLRGMLAPASLLPATRRARAILRDAHARVVIGMGGYPTVPAVIAARSLRIPSVIHEANAVPGLANQAAARFTPNIGVTFQQTIGGFGRRRPRLVGMPLRASIAGLDRGAARAEAIAHFGLEPARRTVLVMGGSLGARRINDAVFAVVQGWSSRPDVQILWSTGRAHIDSIRGRLRASVLQVRCEPFIDRMDLAYAAADVVVARAGSSSVNEIGAVGVPSILVPYPHARRREQDENARALTEPGAAIAIADDDLDGERLMGAFASILDDPARAEAMARAARGAVRVDAAERMAEWALELAGMGS